MFGAGAAALDFVAGLATAAGFAATLAFTAGAGFSTGAGLSANTDLVEDVGFLPCAAATLCESRRAFIACDKDVPALPDSAAGSLDTDSIRVSVVGVAAGTSAGRGGDAGILAWLGSGLFDAPCSEGP